MRSKLTEKLRKFGMYERGGHILVMPSLNGSPITEIQVIRHLVKVRSLHPDGSYYSNGSSGWAPVARYAVRHWAAPDSLVSTWLRERGITA